MLLKSLVGGTNPRGTELRPPELPQSPQRMGRSKKGGLTHVPAVIFDNEAHGVDCECSADRHDGLQLICPGLAFNLG
jgi:hypothetical protein